MTKFKFLLFLLIFVFSKIHSQDTTATAQAKAESLLKKLQQHYANGDYQLHKDFSDSLLLVSEKNGLTKMHILALNNQAVYHNNRNEKQLALENYHSALEKCNSIPDDYRTKAIVLVNMGNTYYRIDANEKAIAAMKQVLSIADKVEKSDKVRAAALLGISNSYNKLGDLEPALAYAQQVKSLGEKTNDDGFKGPALSNIGDILIKLKRYEEALQATSSALDLPTLKKPTKSRAWALLNKGIANYHLNNYAEAESELLACSTLSKDKDIIEVEMYAHEYLAMVYEEKENYSASYKAQKEFSRLKEMYEADTKSATKKEVNKNIAEQNKKIEESEKELQDLTENSTRIKLWGGGLLLIAIGSIFFLVVRRKKLLKEQTKLRSQYKVLLASSADSNTNTKIAPKTIEKESSTSKPYENSSLTEADREHYKTKILAYIESDEPHLNADLTQTDFADKIGISSHHFSEVLHYGFEQNFYNFINSYRIVQAQKLIKATVNDDTKIIAIAFDSGFKSKASFNRVFKKHTGLTPSEYKKTL